MVYCVTGNKQFNEANFLFCYWHWHHLNMVNVQISFDYSRLPILLLFICILCIFTNNIRRSIPMHSLYGFLLHRLLTRLNG